MGTARLLRLLNLFTVLQRVRSWSIVVPTTVTAVEGNCVVVPCHTQPHSRVIWYQYHSLHYLVVYDGLRPHKVEDQFRGRTSVLGNAATGNCTLTINNVKTADNLIQIYVWINPDSKQTQKFHDQIVTIYVERTAPIISTEQQIAEGQLFQANCSIKYSCPFWRPSLHWNKSQFLENSALIHFNKEEQGQWLHRETLHGLATYKMHNSKISCTAQFRTFTTESQQITLNVLYKPVTVTLKVEEAAEMEGDSIILECAANSNPQPHTYSWFRRQMGQNTQVTSAQGKMTFHNIRRDTSLSCLARNDFGVRQSDWMDLDVQHAPVILPESSCSLAGDDLRCVCWAEASPEASIYWIIDGNDTFPHPITSVSPKKKNIVHGNISVPAKSQPKVSCTAWNTHGNDTKQLSIVETSSLFIWLPFIMILGVALLLGCGVYIYRRYPRDRSLNSLANVQQDQRYGGLQRSQAEDTQSSRPERNPEVDRLSCVYDNDVVEEVRRSVGVQQQHQINAKDVHCDMEVYRNC